MKCPHCACSFCWLCLTEIDDVPAPDHYAAWNVQGCPGRQMEGSAPPGVRHGMAYHLTGWQLEGWRKNMFMSIVSIFYAWFFIVICPISIVLASVLIIVCSCCTAAFFMTSYTDIDQWQRVYCF